MRFVARTLRPSTRRITTALPVNFDISKLLEAALNVSERSMLPRTSKTFKDFTPLEVVAMFKVLLTTAMLALATTAAAIVVVPLF